MTINFPDPAGQTPENEFSPTSHPAKTYNNTIYKWEDPKWVAYIPSLDDASSVEVGESPPPFPNEGDLWWDSSKDSGRLYIWYYDGGTGQWVDASPDSPSSTYWEKNGSNLSPADDTDNVVIGGGDITLNADGQGKFSRVDVKGGVTVDGGSSLSTGLYYRDDSESYGLALYSNGSSEINRKAFIKTDGSSAFAGEMNVGDIYTQGGTRFLPTGEVYIRSDRGGSAGVFQVQNGSNDVGDRTISFLGDGQATFSGEMNVGNILVDGGGTRLLPTGEVYIRQDGGGSVGVFQVQNGSIDTADTTISFLANGAGTFAKSLLIGDDSAGFDFARINKNYVQGQLLIGLGADDNAQIFSGRSGGNEHIVMMANGLATFDNRVELAKTLDSGVAGMTIGNSQQTVITANGFATFAGTVTANGTVLTRAGGVTLDVGDRLEKVDSALQSLKTALVTTTDHASLKAALIAALADI